MRIQFLFIYKNLFSFTYNSALMQRIYNIQLCTRVADMRGMSTARVGDMRGMSIARVGDMRSMSIARVGDMCGMSIARVATCNEPCYLWHGVHWEY